MKIHHIMLGLGLLLDVFAHAGIGSTRELVILSEYGHNENISFTLNHRELNAESSEYPRPYGLGAATGLLLSALYQEVPVLVPAPLWDVIVEHKKLFDAVTQLDLQRAYEGYGRYSYFGSLRGFSIFRERCLHVKQRYEKLMGALSAQEPRIAVRDLLSKDRLFDYAGAPHTIKRMDVSDWTEHLLYLMCSAVPHENYSIKEITLPGAPDLPFYLFLPKAAFTGKELACDLGLKIHQYKDVVNLFAKRKYPAHYRNIYPTLLVDVLKEIFVTKSDACPLQQSWSIFIMGHGFYSEGGTRLTAGKLVDTDDRVAGLSIEDFKKFLLFLEKSIDTKLLFYSSCCSGGKSWLKVFTNQNKPLSLSYVVFADNLTEAPSLGQCPIVRLTFFNNEDDVLDWAIDWENKKIALDSSYDFPTFFATARSVAACDRCMLHKLLYSLNPVHRMDTAGRTDCDHRRLYNYEVNNITSVRLPHTTWFSAIDDIGTFVPLRSKSSSRSSPMTIKQDSDLVLLCDSAVPYALKFLHNTRVAPFPSLVSLIPGKAAHKINSIEAPHASLQSIVKGFFACNNLAVPKLFCIPKLLCAATSTHRKAVEFHDVSLFNHIPASIIDGSSEYDLNKRFYNGIIAYKNNQPYIFLWDSFDPVPSQLYHLIESQRGFNTIPVDDLYHFFNNTFNSRAPGNCPVISVDELSVALK